MLKYDIKPSKQECLVTGLMQCHLSFFPKGPDAMKMLSWKPKLHLQTPKQIFSLLNFMGMGALPACMCAHHLLAWCLPAKAIRGSWVAWNWSYRLLWITMWVLGIKHGSSGRAASVLPAEPSVQFLWNFCLETVMYHKWWNMEWTLHRLHIYILLL